MAGMQEIMQIRPAELEIAPTFQGSITEAPVNVYRMKVLAQSYDARRMSFRACAFDSAVCVALWLSDGRARKLVRLV